MSIQVENNLRNKDNEKLFKQRTHYMPCKIEEDGDANVGKYFEPYVNEDENGDLTATFRGYPLDGIKMNVPEGYTGVVVTETKRPLVEDANRKFQVSGGFKEFFYWNWDKKPSKNDNLAKALEWMDFAEAVAVASKSCKCGHTFFASRRAADNLPAVEDIRRRTGRVRRSQPQFYDAQHYQKQNKRTPKKRSLSRSIDDDYKGKEKETATARARRRRALRRAQREPPPAGDRTRDPTPQLRPAQLARCNLILQEINRKMTAVTWQPPTEA